LSRGDRTWPMRRHHLGRISMVPKWALNAVNDQICTDNRTGMIGGKIVIVGGDFRQILPIVSGGGRDTIFSFTVKRWEGWRVFHKFSLIENMRVDRLINDGARWNGLDFREYLLRIGQGEMQDDDEADIPIEQGMLIASREELIEFVFSELRQNPPPE